MRSAGGSPGKNTEALIWDLLLSPEKKNRTHDLDLWYRQSKSAAPGCIWHFTSKHVIYCKSGSLVKFGTLREFSTERTDCRWLTSSERKTAEHGKQTALTHKPQQQVVISSAATLLTPVKGLCYYVMISDSSVWIHSSSQKPNKTRSNCGNRQRRQLFLLITIMWFISECVSHFTYS